MMDISWKVHMVLPDDNGQQPLKAAAEGAIYHDALAALPKAARNGSVALEKMDGCNMTSEYFGVFSIKKQYTSSV